MLDETSNETLDTVVASPGNNREVDINDFVLWPRRGPLSNFDGRRKQTVPDARINRTSFQAGELLDLFAPEENRLVVR